MGGVHDKRPVTLAGGCQRLGGIRRDRLLLDAAAGASMGHIVSPVQEYGNPTNAETQSRHHLEQCIPYPQCEVYRYLSP